jgi:hypothetical protein
MKIIVAGTRDYHDKLNVWMYLDDRNTSFTEVITGMALQWLWDKNPYVGGPDRYGYEWATANNIPVKAFPADWSVGLSAGFRRNAEMADYADAAFIFWDGVSTGTEDMIKQMKKRKKHYQVIRTDCNGISFD